MRPRCRRLPAVPRQPALTRDRVKAKSASALLKGRLSGRPLLLWRKRRNGRKRLAPMPRSWLRRRIGNLNVHSESVRGAHEARLTSCRVLSHDAASFVCRRARRAASSRFGRAGADRGDSACRRDFPGAVSQSGEPGRRGDIARAARIDPRESTCRDGCFSAAVHFGESAGADFGPREPVHAPGGDADGGD